MCYIYYVIKQQSKMKARYQIEVGLQDALKAQATFLDMRNCFPDVTVGYSNTYETDDEEQYIDLQHVFLHSEIEFDTHEEEEF